MEAPSQCGAEFGGEYRIHLLGRHQVVDALFAIAVGVELGLDRAELRGVSPNARPARMRLQLWEANGICVLDDAYNANADSMLAALQALKELPCKGRRVAVLGDMAELGAQSESAHEEVGRYAVELGIGQLFAVGKMASVMAKAARDAGLNRVIEFADVESGCVGVEIIFETGRSGPVEGFAGDAAGAIAETLRAVENRKKNRMFYYLSQHCWSWRAGTPWADGFRRCDCSATSPFVALARRSRRWG